MLKNGETVIGLFEGMFPKNMLTFNPGWNQNAQNLDDFDDVRDIQKSLLAAGVTLDTKSESSKGPASIMLTDPDGKGRVFKRKLSTFMARSGAGAAAPLPMSCPCGKPGGGCGPR